MQPPLHLNRYPPINHPRTSVTLGYNVFSHLRTFHALSPRLEDGPGGNAYFPFCVHRRVHTQGLDRCPKQKYLMKSSAEEPLPSSPTLTRARPRSRRNCCCSGAPSRWPAPSRGARPPVMPPPIGCAWSSNAVFPLPPRSCNFPLMIASSICSIRRATKTFPRIP